MPAATNGTQSAKAERNQSQEKKNADTTVSEPDTSSPDRENLVTIYVNKDCRCGPNFDQAKLSNIPLQYGPGPMNRVLRDAVQGCVDAAAQAKQTLAILRNRQGNGDVVVRAKYDNQVHTLRLPPVDTISELNTYLELLSEGLGCCENYYSTKQFSGNCHKCSIKANSGKDNDDNTPKRKGMHRENGKSNKKRKAALEEPRSESAASASNTRGNSTTLVTCAAALPVEEQASPANNSPTPTLTQPAQAKVLPMVKVTERQTATSTTTNPSGDVRRSAPLPGDPSEWTVDDVIRYLSEVDSAISVHAQLFQRHEIDGKALLLLTSDMMMRYMGLKLGPSLKICNIVNKLKGRRHVSM